MTTTTVFLLGVFGVCANPCIGLLLSRAWRSIKSAFGGAYGLGCAFAFMFLLSGSPFAYTATIVNPSFEANTFVVYPGYSNGNGPITGWESGGMVGLNPIDSSGNKIGPFTDNGEIPDGIQAAFLQANSSLSQVIRGLTPQQHYEIQYFENARTCCGGTARCEVWVEPLANCPIRMPVQIVPTHDVVRVGGTNPYLAITSVPFVASCSDMRLTFVSSLTNGDATVLIDKVSIRDNGTTGLPPRFFGELEDQIVAPGETARFIMGIAYEPPIEYRWYFKGGVVSMERELLVEAHSKDVAGEYYVVATTPSGAITSRRALLSIRPKLSVQSMNANAGTITYSWKAFPSSTFQLLAREKLESGSWTPVGEIFPANGDAASVTITVGSGNKFFRIAWIQ